MRLLIFGLLLILLACSCKKEDACENGIQDKVENAIDCGGDCEACPTCYDAIQNGNETGVDCGGNCGGSCETEQIDYFDFLLGTWYLDSIGYFNNVIEHMTDTASCKITFTSTPDTSSHFICLGSVNGCDFPDTSSWWIGSYMSQPMTTYFSAGNSEEVTALNNIWRIMTFSTNQDNMVLGVSDLFAYEQSYYYHRSK